MGEGVLPIQALRRLVDEGRIRAARDFEESQFQPASLDLRIGEHASRIRASFLPQDHEARSLLRDLVMYEIDLREGAVLEPGNVYLLPLSESLDIPADLAGHSNPKSSTGRLDVFTRLICDFSHRFDEVPRGYSGPLFLEVFPRSFPIRVRTGDRLNQIRFYRGRAGVEDADLVEAHRESPLLFHPDGRPVSPDDIRVRDGIFLSLSLHPGQGERLVGYKARRNSAVIDLSRRDHYRPLEFWEPIYPPGDDFLILEPEEFYILGSRERIRVPPRYSAEMIEFDAGSGELRTHYAGFFDCGFGHGDGGARGTRVVLEVRPHDVPFKVEHGQVFFKVRFDRMLEPPEAIYGRAIGSHYSRQGLTLSAHFFEERQLAQPA